MLSNHETQTKPAGGQSLLTDGLGCMPRVLDPCCGSRMMWFNRQHPDAVFGDKRTEQHVLCDGRTLRIEPDVLLDFTDLPYPDGSFNLVVFDPPHLHTAGPKSWMAAKYGKLTGDWREELRKGFAECFRVLARNGTLIFKWNETQVKVREVLALTPVQPLFGHPTGRKGLTHWMVFMSPNAALTGAEGVRVEDTVMQQTGGLNDGQHLGNTGLEAD